MVMAFLVSGHPGINTPRKRGYFPLCPDGSDIQTSCNYYLNSAAVVLWQAEIYSFWIKITVKTNVAYNNTAHDLLIWFKTND